jgi:hypothetical protein
VFSEPVAVQALVRAWLDDVLVGDGDRPPRRPGEVVTPRSRHGHGGRA